MKVSEDHRKLLKIVTMYYEQGLTQSEISKKMGISRPVVSKMLQQAKESGIVTVSIKDESAYTTNLALQIEHKYQLKEVIVVSSKKQENTQRIQQRIGKAAAYYLNDQLKEDMSIGLSWGTTLADMIEEIPYSSFPKIEVCPLVGGVSSEHLYFDTNHLVFQLAEKLNSRCRYFYAPALAESVELAEILVKSQLIGSAIVAAKKVDLAIIGVGNPNEQSTWKQLGYIQEKDMSTIIKTQVKGDAVASLFDKSGKTVNNEISKRMIGIKVEDLKEIPEVMIIGSGIEKAVSILPLVMGQCCSILVIDQLLAEALI